MLNRSKFVLLICYTLLISGCGPAVYGPARPVRLAHVDGSVGNNPQFNCTQGNFISSNDINQPSMKNSNLGLRFSSKVCAAIHDSANDKAQREMLEAGFTLVKTSCNDYFAQKSGNQTRVRTTRAAMGPIANALSGVIGLINFSSESEESDVLAVLSILSNLTWSALDVYEQEFLFDADNIEDVRGLTMRAIAASQNNILANKRIDFDFAIRELTDHQMICTPQSILRNVRVAIKATDFKARTPRGEAPAFGKPETVDEPAEAEPLEVESNSGV